MTVIKSQEFEKNFNAYRQAARNGETVCVEDADGARFLFHIAGSTNPVFGGLEGTATWTDLESPLENSFEAAK